MISIQIHTVHDLAICERAFTRQVEMYTRLKTMMENCNEPSMVDYANTYLNAANEMLHQVIQAKDYFPHKLP